MTRRVENVAVREGYDRWAGIYDTGDNPLVALDEEVVPRLLGSVEGKRVLELACGTGRHTVRLADAAARVTALDFSRGMLEKAKKRLGSREVTLSEADSREPLCFDSGAFDLVLCCLALEHIQDLSAVFREAHRVVASGGAFVCSDLHPAMRLRGKQASFDEADGTEVLVEGYAHPISSYFLAAIGAGFRVTEAEEHVVSEEFAARTPCAAKYVGWPILFAMRAVKD